MVLESASGRAARRVGHGRCNCPRRGRHRV